MPRKRNHADGSPIKELGEFEFDDVSVSKTGKIVGKEKCQLEFPCFKSFPVGQREGESSSFAQAPSVSQASEIDDLESVSDVDDAEEDVNVIDKYNKRRLSLLTSWERQRRSLLKAHSDYCCIPQHALCSSCSETSPE